MSAEPIFYKDWVISPSKYVKGFYVGVNQKDCDAFEVLGKTIEQVIVEINELT